jgi:Nucleoside-diphosphate-sugar pyrophosphorylase involved in lipopolysaccharide biosynthesis/translation initiation factor 2B, gamma/epsilon subunits (eIF-2Bgamma/eIF-2Bepsilon)
MILAAGLGTRLRPLTDNKPKALVEVGGRSLLEITLARLRTLGITEVIVNVHHFAEMMEAYLREKNNFGMRVEVSREDVLLDTGGGLKKAAWFFVQDGGEEPFLLHNVDVISTIDLEQIVKEHKRNDALATLAVRERKSSRQLLFDDRGQLCGRRISRDAVDEIVRPAKRLQPLAFSGIHVISPRLLQMMTEDGVFSIIEAYLRLAAASERIQAFRADQYYWRDLGKPESIQQAELDLEQKILTY